MERPPAQRYSFIALAATGLADLVATELKAFGAQHVVLEGSRVLFQGELATAYRACLWSRYASRILMILDEFACADFDALYHRTRALPWGAHFSARNTFAVSFHGTHRQLQHTQFAVHRVKDGIVDFFQQGGGKRPSVDRERPEMVVAAVAHGDSVRLCLDLSGDGLHQRGYRQLGTAAPLKETLAAALLARAGWARTDDVIPVVYDPMCGSGTIAIEAALMAADIAPGLIRMRFGFAHWKKHDPVAWDALVQEAEERREAGRVGARKIFASDSDPRAIAASRENARAAGVQGLIQFDCKDALGGIPPQTAGPGLIATNPPYGHRIGVESPENFYREFARNLREHFGGWRASILVGEDAPAGAMELRPSRSNTFYNGPIKCTLLHFEIHAQRTEPVKRDEVEALANRLVKNKTKAAHYAQRQETDAYRLYDADLPEYNFAVDVYGDSIHLQEYRPPVEIAERKRVRHRTDMLEALERTLRIPRDKIHIKERARQRGTAQYERQSPSALRRHVQERGARFLVDLTSYVDTGLFLDTRPVRYFIRERAQGMRFLNLFSYTASASVHAALGGARSTTSVDLSNTYTEWARRNMQLNGLSPDTNRLVQADTLAWLARDKGIYDLILLDPPTFSNSKRMADTLDIQRDHVDLIQKSLERLDPTGTLIFVTNNQRFKLDAEALTNAKVDNWSARSVPEDFRRSPRIHQCYLIRRVS